MSETIEHKCPCCGGSVIFDAASQKVKCPYCDSEFDVSEMMKNEGDLTEVSDDLATDGGEEWSEQELYGLSEYQCQSCGGDIYSDATTSATLCPYCGNAVVLKGRLSGVLKPDKVIPFKMTKEQALKGLEEHCGGKRFVPKKFIQNNRLEEIKGLYVPFWVYDAELDASVEYEGVDVRTWTSGNTEYTERKYYHVVRAGDIAFDHVPADGSSKMPDDLMESIEPFDYNQAQDFTTGYLSGYVADKYDVDQERVRPRVRKRMQEGAADAFKSTVHYDEIYVKGIESEAKKSTVNYVLYPVWLMNTEWEDKKFIFAMNGQTGKMVGNLPTDMIKLGGVAISIFVALTALITLGYYFSTGEFDLLVVIGGALLAGIISGVVFAYYKSQHRSVEFQHGAANYYRQNSMNIKVKEDQFVRKSVTTRRISSD